MRDYRSLFAARLDGTLAAMTSLRSQLGTVNDIAHAIRQRLETGGLLCTCGNGGSAAEALHLAEELIGRYRGERAPYRAICLNADPTAITCIANDYGFDSIFARQCDALLGPGDVLVVFSTSGRSPNIKAALESARLHGALTVGLLGRDGGTCAPLCDMAVIIPSQDTAQIQEAHQVVLHMLCEALESDPA